MGDLLQATRQVLDTVLLRIGDTAVSRRGGRPGLIGTVTGLIHYTVLAIGFGIAPDTAGIDLTALFAAGAIFAVGLGFAMQKERGNVFAFPQLDVHLDATVVDSIDRLSRRSAA